MQKAKWLSEQALQTAEKRREAKGKDKRNDIPSDYKFPKSSKEK